MWFTKTLENGQSNNIPFYFQEIINLTFCVIQSFIQRYISENPIICEKPLSKENNRLKISILINVVQSFPAYCFVSPVRKQLCSIHISLEHCIDKPNLIDFCNRHLNCEHVFINLKHIIPQKMLSKLGYISRRRFFSTLGSNFLWQ